MAPRHDSSPRATLLNWLRLQERLIGTKEGCAEGGCRHCTVVIVRERGSRLVYEPVDSCITLLGQLDIGNMITVEDLADDGALHPVQEALAREHGSQCGFCTPGIVMSLFAHYHQCNGISSRQNINDALAGNLCRCTGYRPIVEAALEACNGGGDDRFSRNTVARRLAIGALNDKANLFVGDDTAFFAAPVSEQSLALLYAQHPDATIIAGATDVGLWITKKLTPIDKIIRVERSPSFPVSKRPPTATQSARLCRWRALRPCLDRSIPTSEVLAASVPFRCAPAALSAATSPTARRSAIWLPC